MSNAIAAKTGHATADLAETRDYVTMWIGGTRCQ